MKRYQCELANTCGYRGSFYEPITEYKYKIQQDCLLQGQAQMDQRVIFSCKATLELALLVCPSICNANSKCQNQVSKSSVKIKRQNQTSKSSVKIKRQN